MQYIDSFLDYLKYEKRCSAHTLVAYETDLKQFAAYMQETGVDEIHVADGSGVIRVTTDPPSLGIDLYQFHPQLEEVSRGTRDVYATPISRKIGEDKLVKYLSIADARGTLYQVGMSVDTLLSF